MTNIISTKSGSHRARAAFVMIALATANILAWVMTWKVSSTYTFLLASGWLAYSFGLRHAVDADHISAIDNVTRKLSLGGKRPLGVGLFFSLGHSTVVVLMCAGFAAASSYVQNHMEHWKVLGGIIGTIVSGAFLYVIGFINLIILIELYRAYKAQSAVEETNAGASRTDIEALPTRRATSWPPPPSPATGISQDQETLSRFAPTGLLGRVLRPVTKMVNHSWQMYFVGFLFGLGFDTATEVGILAISARSANHGIPFGVVMLLPLLFTMGMCLIDTLDGILMAGAYGWAALSPLRQFRYNFSITLASILVAFFVGTYEMVQLAVDQMSRHGAFRRFLDNLDFGWLGIAIIGGFLVIWAAAATNSRRAAASSTTG